MLGTLVIARSAALKIEIKCARLLRLVKLEALWLLLMLLLLLLLLELELFRLVLVIVLKLILRFHLSMQLRKTDIIYSELKVVSMLKYSKLMTLTFEVEGKSGVKMLLVCNKYTVSVYPTSAT